MRAISTIFLLVFCGLFCACGGGTDGVGVGGDTDTTGGKLAPGQDCTDEPDGCMDGYTCSRISTVCQLAGVPGSGTMPEGSPCPTTDECALGLACSADGTCQLEGAEGTTSVGSTCEETSECQMFLKCIDGICQGYQPPFWAGATCEPRETDKDIPGKVYFEVDTKTSEFYRLPFPNDIRRQGGKVDFEDHANPGLLIEEYGNPVDEFFSMVSDDLDGFGTMSAVYFRFNYWPDDTTIKLGDSIYIVSISPESKEYGEQAWTGFHGNATKNMYICHNWLAILPSVGNPLDPNTTYAAIMTTAVNGGDGKPLNQDDDFKVMLDDSDPGSGKIGDAWNTYAPLRAYLTDQDIATDTIAVAAVFTTGTPTTPTEKIREVVRAEADPAVNDLATDDSDDAYTLMSGTVTTPFFQSGTRPFIKITDGGFIEYDDDGLPLIAEEEDVKFALSVPTGEVPETGWPVMLFAHGTGGSEMSFVGNGVAARMAALGVATIGMEQVQHGDRRGLTAEEADKELNQPDYLFYNLINPKAARDNILQAAADLFQLVRVVENFSTITTEEVLLDPDKMYFFGHSQGTQGQFMAAAYEPAVKGIILSGAGGYLLESLLGKTEPIDVPTALRLAMMDVSVDRYHPLLNIVQAAFDQVDPLNYRRAIFVDDMTEMGISARSVFMSSGVGDSYTPEKTQYAIAKGLWLKQSVTSGTAIDGISELEELPHTRTYGFGGGVTAVVVRYEPGDYDGHFVMFNNEDAIKQADEFVRTMIADEYPTLIAP
jgi:pimeloyl-ACP methyl ester carboxylesterase